MFKKLGLIAMFLVSLSAMTLASVGGESKYVKLYAFDAATNGPITARTTHINAFVDFIDSNDLMKSAGFAANSLLSISVASSYINDLENNPGTMNQFHIGDIGPNGYNLNGFEGETSIYLGEYTIVPSQHPYFRGGDIIQFNFTITSGKGTNATNTSVYASQVVPFYQDQR